MMIFGGIIGLAAGAVLTTGLIAATQLSQVESELTTLRSAPPATAAEIDHALSMIGEKLTISSALTHTPLWAIAAHLPLLGNQLHAIAVTSSALSDAVNKGIRPAAVTLWRQLPALAPTNGTINLAAVSRIQHPLSLAAHELTRASDELDTLSTDQLVPALSTPIEHTKHALNTLSQLATNLADTTQLLPSILGGQGSRTYLLVCQNNAEWRSLGGIASALAAVEVDNGRLQIVKQENSRTMPGFTTPVMPLSAEQTAIFGTQPTQWVQNITQLPDFSDTARVAVAMWERTHTQQISGVLAVDPVALSYLLRATGSVTLPNGDQITSANAVSVLLNQVYLRYTNPAEKDSYFAAAALAAFDKLSAGQFNGGALVKALVQAGSERRLLLWSPVAREESLIQRAWLAGGLPSQHGEAHFGVYLNDVTGSKMDYYQSATTHVERSGTVPGVWSLTVRIENNAPSDVSQLPSYITGGGAYGVAPGTTSTLVYVYLPRNTRLTGDFSEVPSGATNTFNGGEMLSYLVTLKQGQRSELSLRVLTSPDTNATVQQTPTANR